ncbi:MULTISPECIES: S8 family serine peptidase [unclassified Pseudomonas]|uniref:S8 family serine peptidase n=1 Tax=unclassified Pseudomonas TaxID=196821 RepID=UPI000A1FA0F4|nr:MULTISPECIES: S8 family serine peptidase [unclassified Pseudomonas]
MKLKLNFTYYRNFRFDGRLHIRCTGDDLKKVNHIRYEVERIDGDDPVSFNGVSVYSQAYTGALVNHGCQALLEVEARAGTYRIQPRVILLDAEAVARGRPAGAAGVIDLEPLLVQVQEQELTRNMLDKVPLASGSTRRRRSLPDVQLPAYEALALSEPGKACPPLIIRFVKGGYQRLLVDLEPESNSRLVQLWPRLKQVIDPQPLLAAGERNHPRLQVLADYGMLKQPASMLNDTFVNLARTLAALEYVESLQFHVDVQEPSPPVFAVIAGLITLLGGVAVVLAKRDSTDAQPTPDFEKQQHYLDAPNYRWKGLNVRRAWGRQVTGKGARIHFSDGGLFPQHEDLRDNPNLRVVTQGPNHNPKHGTASAGILVATANGLGVSGIAKDSELYLYNNRAEDATWLSLTISALLRHVEPGDIVGINRQTINPADPNTLLPAVHDALWRDMVRELVRRGAVVVAAGCNGSSRTDADHGTVAGHGVDLSQHRNFADHADVGAILVGACQSWDGKPHAYSNHNYRYRMLNAWGDSVVTLSYGDLQDEEGDDRDYTDTYAGTSSATPMVTGALSLIQSYAMEQHHIYLNADQMHLLVMASGYGEATLPDTDVLPMGARPNVEGALVLLDQILGGGRFHPA